FELVSAEHPKLNLGFARFTCDVFEAEFGKRDLLDTAPAEVPLSQVTKLRRIHGGAIRLVDRRGDMEENLVHDALATALLHFLAGCLETHLIGDNNQRQAPDHRNDDGYDPQRGKVRLLSASPPQSDQDKRDKSQDEVDRCRVVDEPPEHGSTSAYFRTRF